MREYTKRICWTAEKQQSVGQFKEKKSFRKQKIVKKMKN